MKLIAKALALLAAVSSIAAYAQDPSGTQGTVQHVIVIIQENRTIDNLFGSNPAFETGGLNIANSGKEIGSTVTFSPVTLYGCYDLGHNHSDFVALYDSGNMDGGDSESVHTVSGCTLSTDDAPYRYADNSSTTLPPNEVQPYFDIAKQFGFANYMFQTNQGPSFPAHQFLFSGTSAPVLSDGDPNSYWTWFGAENPQVNGMGVGTPTGCLGKVTPNLNTVLELDPNSDPESPGWANSSLFTTGGAGFPCYNHNTIASVLDTAKVTWKYYTNDPASLWTAPNAIQSICNPSAAGGPCSTATGSDWNNVISETTANGHPAQILEDIRDCHLAQVTFVTPDGAWSDHAGCRTLANCNPAALGPAWVASIVNGVGEGMDKFGSTCNTKTSPAYWKNTVVLITWDDWGGWYDHVVPPRLGYNGLNAGGGQYVYGFRVPLLAVSAYSPKKGYISGPAASNTVTQCPVSPNTKYCHDFGSILNFIEFAFGSKAKSLPEIYSTYPYADHWAMDGPNVCGADCVYSLSDFFSFKLPQATFTEIAAPVLNGTTLDASYFIGYTGTSQPPDEDGD